VTIGKLPLTPRAKKIIEFSIEEARNLKHNYVGTEHILLGLIRDEEGMAFAILTKLGLTVERLREGILSLLSDPRAPTEGFADQAGRWLPLELRTRALEQQLANVRLLLGALFGAGVGVMLVGRLGALVGLLVGGGIALFGRLIPALFAGAIAGGCVASTQFGDEIATIAGAVVGALLSACVAEVGRPSRSARIADAPGTTYSATGPEGRK
jgi:ClpA/ClpB-like protein